MAFFADCTDFPALFKEAYWGTHSADGEHARLAAVFANRNAFARNYSLARHVEMEALKANRAAWEFVTLVRGDHREYYETTGGDFVFVISFPVNGALDRRFDEEMQKKYRLLGFTEHAPLYDFNNQTLSRVFPKFESSHSSYI